MIVDFTFKGVSLSSYGGYVTRLPAFPQPEERGEWVRVRGRDGDAWRPDGGHEQVTLDFDVYLPPEADIFAAARWLTGSGRASFSTWPCAWNAYAVAGMSFDFWQGGPLDGCTGRITLKADPQRYMVPAPADKTVTAGGTFDFGVSAESLPIIYVEGAGSATVMIGAYTLIISDIGGKMTLDCERLLAWHPDTMLPRTDRVSTGGGYDVTDPRFGRWPRILPGSNLVTVTGGATKVVVTPNGRC